MELMIFTRCAANRIRNERNKQKKIQNWSNWNAPRVEKRSRTTIWFAEKVTFIYSLWVSLALFSYSLEIFPGVLLATWIHSDKLKSRQVSLRLKLSGWKFSSRLALAEKSVTATGRWSMRDKQKTAWEMHAMSGNIKGQKRETVKKSAKNLHWKSLLVLKDLPMNARRFT